MFIVSFIVAVCKFISEFYVAPKMCFGFDANDGATGQKISKCPRLIKNIEATEQSWIGLPILHSIYAPGKDSGGSVSKQV